jgi:hypothetical protein
MTVRRMVEIRVESEEVSGALLKFSHKLFSGY